jgi:hypothetical protein
VESVSFSPDGRYIVSGSWDNTLRLWDASTGREIEGFDGRGHTDHVESVSFSPDGRYIVSGSLDYTLIIRSLARILGPVWLEDYLATPLILTPAWFPEHTISYLKETDQGIITPDRPLARCGECGKLFPVEQSMLGREIRCPARKVNGTPCNRLLKINDFMAGEIPETWLK